MFAQQQKSKERNRESRAPRRAPAARPTVQRTACACGGGCPRCRQELPLQAKLTVSRPGDTLEQEADRVSQQVVQMPQPALADTQEDTGLRLSRYADTSAQNSPPGAIDAPASVHDALRSPAQPLDPATRSFMEPRFGHDFSGVRVHAGAAAAQSAEAMDAQAYTVGRDIVFGAGRFEPGTHTGRQLLAHELAHVVQQSAGATRPMLQKKPKAKKAGSITQTFDQKVVDKHIWPAAWGSIGWVKDTAIGLEVWDALIQAGAVVTIIFVAERADIPAGAADTAVLGFCDNLGSDNFDVYVLAGQESYYWERTKYGSSTMKSKIVQRPSEEIADTLFHELLHAWFQVTFPGAAIPTGHTANALPIGDPKFDAKEYDPEFLDRLQRFRKELEKSKQKMKGNASKTK